MSARSVGQPLRRFRDKRDRWHPRPGKALRSRQGDRLSNGIMSTEPTGTGREPPPATPRGSRYETANSVQDLLVLAEGDRTGIAGSVALPSFAGHAPGNYLVEVAPPAGAPCCLATGLTTPLLFVRGAWTDPLNEDIARAARARDQVAEEVEEGRAVSWGTHFLEQVPDVLSTATTRDGSSGVRWPKILTDVAAWPPAASLARADPQVLRRCPLQRRPPPRRCARGRSRPGRTHLSLTSACPGARVAIVDHQSPAGGSLLGSTDENRRPAHPGVGGLGDRRAGGLLRCCICGGSRPSVPATTPSSSLWSNGRPPRPSTRRPTRVPGSGLAAVHGTVVASTGTYERPVV